MTAHLMIENPGVAPVEAYTLLGASTKRDSDLIGKFGTGNNHAVLACLRKGIAPTVFAGMTRMNFGTRPQVIDDGLKAVEHQRVFVKFGGTSTKTEDLGYTGQLGTDDWADDVALALREFVSNALDRVMEEGDAEFTSLHAGEADFVAKFRENRRNLYKLVVIRVVDENQVRAKAGRTRVFVPLTAEVLEFYNNLGKWFLHFSEPDLVWKAILPKTGRNLTGRRAAVIYRRGVRVREFESSDVASLFDYNLNDLKIDESRKVDDWNVLRAAANALRDADAADLTLLLRALGSGAECWERTFDSYGLSSWAYGETKQARREAWSLALGAVAENAVLTTSQTADYVKRKGYTPVIVPESYLNFATQTGVRTGDMVLTQDDKDGREIIEATPLAVELVDWAWGLISRANMTNGREKPAVKSFRAVMDAGSRVLGFYRDGTVFLNQAADAMNEETKITALEEVVHHVTQSSDMSRDMQDYVLRLAVVVSVM